jgi:hypothetical protein
MSGASRESFRNPRPQYSPRRRDRPELGEAVEPFPPHRRIWPAELDVMAQLAGFELFQEAV